MRIAWILILAGVLSSCGNSNTTENKPVISVTILPQQYFVEQLTGDLFEINVMIPPGASPATYEPSPAQLADLTRTDLYLKMGHTGFELSWMEKITATNSSMTVVNLSEGIDLIMENSPHNHGEKTDDHGHHHGGIDPHTWLSPKSARTIARNILNALSASYPDHKDAFSMNYSRFMTRLDSLDGILKEKRAGMEGKAFFTYHPSLSYFARDYNLVQIPLELMGKSPSASYLKELIDTGLEQNIGIVFLQMQFDQHNAEVLAREIDAEIVQINPLDPEWYDQMIFIADKLVNQ